jgi:hypothetical protein
MELLVVLAIIVSITAVVLTSQGSFNKTLLLANTAYDIALTLRSTESFGISTLASGSTANAGRGTHFEKGTQNSFILFADTSPIAPCPTLDCKPGNHTYEDGQDTLVQNYMLGNSMKISDFCARNAATGIWSCAYPHDGYSGGLTTLDIVFARPNPDAFIRVNGDPDISYNGACLKVSSLQGGARYVNIAPSGRITANATSCP